MNIPHSLRATSARHLLTLAAALGLLLGVASCSVPRDVAYFQDAEALHGMAVATSEQFRLRPEDRVKINVNSSNAMLEEQFSLTMSGQQSTSSRAQVVYTVDEQGTIQFPVLGKIRAEGKTRQELAAYIQQRLRSRELVDDAIVTVEYVDLCVNVLGEVNHAGIIPITKDHFTILDALSGAGDLTINGNRTRVMVTRQVDGVNQVYFVDLTQMQSLLQSPAFYLQQNDLVYVTPNDKRKREAQSVGNTFNTPAVWISLASLATTIAALLIR